MFARVDGEMLKVVKVDNGWIVYVWDPEAPPPVLPGQVPCSQQPVRWWKAYIFATIVEVNVFTASFLESGAE